MPNPTACAVIIGNEILSGRTADVNINFLAKELTTIGIRLAEVRVIPDDPQMIIDTVNAVRRIYTYVFTTGGIGPTHDDITSECIARAFAVPYERHPEAEKLLLSYYKPEQVNAARMKMADMPRGAKLIANPVSVAPGFIIENVYVMAGVPKIMQAMFEGIRHQLKGGPPMLSRTLSTLVTEGTIGVELGEIQKRHPDTEIGSYPFIRDGKLGTSLVVRSADKAKLDAAFEAISNYIRFLTIDFSEE